MGHTRHSAGQTLQVLPGTAVLVCDEQALIGCFTLKTAANMDKKSES